MGDRLKNYKVRTRKGYRPQPSRFSAADKTALSESTPAPVSTPASSGGSGPASER
jgi:hypothetical protein